MPWADREASGREMMEVKINVAGQLVCMVCGSLSECAELLIWLPFMPGVTFRLLVCQSCWARTLRQFSKENG